MAAVPDTTTFTLNNVKASLEASPGGTFNDLVSMFAVATNAGSPLVPPENLLTYLEEFPDSLYGFRGYNHVSVTFGVTPGSWSFPYTASSKSFTVTAAAGVTWTITEDPDKTSWISSSPTSGTGSGSTNVTVTLNPESEGSRNMNLIFTPSIGSPVSVFISQAQNPIQ